MDLNELRARLRSSKPVQVSREGRLERARDDEDGDRFEPEPGRKGPSRLKSHTFAR